MQASDREFKFTRSAMIGKGRLVTLLLLAGSSFLFGETEDWRDMLSKEEHEAATLIDQKVPMRDGARLSADVYLPKQEGKWPVILERIPYDNSGEWYVNRALYFARRGYAYVLQDCRGRYDSEGKWYPWFNEIDDGRDSLDWCGTQRWSNGNVGMNGMSYMGLVQWLAAPTGSPYLKAIIPQMASADFYLYGMNYFGGVFTHFINLPWSIRTSSRSMQTYIPYDPDALFKHLPIIEADKAATGREIDFYRDWVRHSSYDDYWKKISNYGKFQKMDLPILQICGWLDWHARSLFANYEGIEKDGTERARRLQKVVVGPWVHTDKPQQKYGVLDFGEASVMDLYELWLRWMDRWLKGIKNGAEDMPPLKLFVMGKNQWRTAEKWPLPDTRWTPYYLNSGGRANSLFGDGELKKEKPAADQPPDSYTYDPSDPVPSLGLEPNGQIYPLDHRPIERRDDVLVYTTEPLDAGLEITGPVQAILHASSSAVDTDWTVKLLDVFPDGRAINLCDGILRARFREPRAIRTALPSPGQYENPVLMNPGEVYEFFVEIGVISHMFLPGHRIRIEVSSSNFPKSNRNLNNGGKLGIDPEIVVAKQTIHHDAERASHILLPVIPTSP